MKTCKFAAANTAGDMVATTRVVQNKDFGHFPSRDFFRLLIKLNLERVQVSELEVSLPLLPERKNSLLSSS